MLIYGHRQSGHAVGGSVVRAGAREGSWERGRGQREGAAGHPVGAQWRPGVSAVAPAALCRVLSPGLIRLDRHVVS
jgi:hypothetical protein